MILLFALALSSLSGFTQETYIDTLTTKYTLPRVRFTQLQYSKMILTETTKVITQKNISASIYKAINLTDQDTFMCVLLDIPTQKVFGQSVYNELIEMTISETRGLYETILYANENFLNKLSFGDKALSYIGRYFRFEIMWSIPPTATAPNGKFTVNMYRKDVGLDNRIVKENILSFSFKDIPDLEKVLQEAIRTYK